MIQDFDLVYLGAGFSAYMALFLICESAWSIYSVFTKGL